MIGSIDEIASRLLLKLPGKNAHSKMMPLPDRLNELPSSDHKQAAVLILLQANNENLEFPLIVRNSQSAKDPHRGQIGLPGGRMEQSDFNLAFTALRETQEEIGVPSEHIKILGSLSPLYVPVSKNLVHPFVAFLDLNCEYNLQDKEIQEVFHCGLNQLLDEKNISKRIINTSYANEISVPGFQIEDRWIWGATAMILAEFKEIFKRGQE